MSAVLAALRTYGLSLFFIVGRFFFYLDILRKPVHAMEEVLFVTHSERMHCDEACAAALLFLSKKTSPSLKNIVRTRDASTMKMLHSKGATLVDVGKVYDPADRKYDHHQTGFDAKFPGETAVPMSSCGLVWLEFGESIVRGFVDDPAVIEHVFKSMYSEVFRGIDGNDNGVAQFGDADVPRSQYKALPIWGMVAMMNQQTTEKRDQDSIFVEAVGMLTTFLTICIRNMAEGRAATQEAEAAFRRGMAASARPHPNVVVCDSDLGELNTNQILHNEDDTAVSFVVFPSQNGNWKIWTRRAIGKGKQFTAVDDIIDEAACVKLVGLDLVFVHPKLFTGAAKNRAAAVAIACESAKAGKGW
jgi:uncharacterized UPF0160 family protein